MFESPESRAALEHVKRFISSNAPAGIIDECALPLVGESAERINEGLNALRCKMEGGMVHGLSPSMQFSFAFVFGEMVRERLREIEIHGMGRA
jgi:hypothetical protein